MATRKQTAGRSWFHSAGAAAYRDLYLWAADPEQEFYPGPIIDELNELIREESSPGTESEEPGGPDLARLRGEVAEWAAADAARYRRLAGAPYAGDGRAALARRIALNCAPLGLISGAWLQWLVGPGNAETELSMLVLGLFAADVGAGHPRADRGSHYRRLLEGLDLAGRVVSDTRLVADQQIADRSFRLPALLLAMSRHGDDFVPELLGADLCLRWVGLAPPLVALRDDLGVTADWDALDSGGPAAAELSLAAARTHLGADPGIRLPRGLIWAFAEFQQWSDEIYTLLDLTLDPGFEMAELLRLRCREALAYHHDFILGGRPLREWFGELDGDGGTGFLRALAASRLVKPGRPEASPLLRGLIEVDGPMFRVFSPEDLTVIRRWIASLSEDATRIRASAPSVPPAAGTPGPAVPPSAAGGDAAPATLREAYHRLMGRRDSPELRRYAVAYIDAWLARSRYGFERVKNPPRRWEPGGLRPWLQEQHDRHNEQFEAGAELVLPPREEVIDTFVQLAPLNLIDGSWLSGFTDYRHASSEMGHFLFATYWDELGNGRLELNHPLIYRDLISDMGLDLPPSASWEFAQWHGFRDESFELPVYWLAISRFPRTFLPETLGLNLAMELSGVGGTYRRDRIALRAYGFSSRYADIHNTIDNVATGHSAWAADAIETYLASVSSTLGYDAAASSWERIRVGFRSLKPPRRPASS